MCRHISGLISAQYAENPFGRTPRARGLKAKGLRYQRSVGEFLAKRHLDVRAGPWIHFSDRHGPGFAQPDFVIHYAPERWIVLEAKLTQTPNAFEQLIHLYLPLLSHLHPNVELVPVQVCRNLREPPQLLIEDLSEASPGATWHWLS